MTNPRSSGDNSRSSSSTQNKKAWNLFWKVYDRHLLHGVVLLQQGRNEEGMDSFHNGLLALAAEYPLDADQCCDINSGHHVDSHDSNTGRPSSTAHTADSGHYMEVMDGSSSSCSGSYDEDEHNFGDDVMDCSAMAEPILTHHQHHPAVAEPSFSPPPNYHHHHLCTNLCTMMEDDKRIVYSVSIPEQANPATTRTTGTASLYQDDLIVVFRRALLLSSFRISHLPHATWSWAHNLLAATLTYNMALAYHLHGLQQGTSLFLKRATEFYSMAYALFNDPPLVNSTRGTTTRDNSNSKSNNSTTVDDSMMHMYQLGLTACTNNIGHVHAHFRSISHTSLCCEEMSARLSAYSPYDRHSQGAISLEEYQVLFVNACLFRPHCTGAPVA